jgi:hypothetical protein
MSEPDQPVGVTGPVVVEDDAALLGETQLSIGGHPDTLPAACHFRTPVANGRQAPQA